MYTEAQKEEARRILRKRKAIAELERRKALRAEESKPQEREATGIGKALDVGFGTGFGNTVAGIRQMYANAMGDDALKAKLAEQAQARNQKYENVSSSNPLSALLGSLAGGVASTPIPGLGQAGLAAKIASNPAVARILGNTLRGATEGGIAAGAQYVPEGSSRLQNLTQGAALGGGLGGALSSVGAGYNALRPSNLFAGNIPTEQIARNLEATKGTQTALGDVLGSPWLKELKENVVAKMPLSGIRQVDMQVKNMLENKGKDLFNEITGAEFLTGRPGNIIKQGVQEGKSIVRKEKNRKYKIVNNLADELGIRLQTDNFSKTATKKLTEMTRSSRLQREFPQEIKDKIKEYSNPNVKETLQDSDIFRSKLKENARKSFREGDDYLGGVYDDLYKSLTDDIEETITKSGNKNLKDLRKEAHSFYKENYAPFKEAEIQKYLNPKSDPDTLVNYFVPIGKNDKGTLLGKLTNVIGKSPNSEELMNALRYGVFQKSAETPGQINPNTFTRIADKLGDFQKAQLFKGKEQELPKLQKYSDLVDLNKEQLKGIFNPGTGQRALSMIPIGLTAGGYTLGQSLGGFLMGVLGAATGAGLVGGQLARKFLTNEKTREKIADKILNPGAERNKALLEEVGKGLEKMFPKAVASQSTETEIKPFRVNVNKYAREE